MRGTFRKIIEQFYLSGNRSLINIRRNLLSRNICDAVICTDTKNRYTVIMVIDNAGFVYNIIKRPKPGQQDVEFVEVRYYANA
jgi:hypothetical protein